MAVKSQQRALNLDRKIMVGRLLAQSSKKEAGKAICCLAWMKPERIRTCVGLIKSRKGTNSATQVHTLSRIKYDVMTDRSQEWSTRKKESPDVRTPVQLNFDNKSFVCEKADCERVSPIV